jgi:hypothetical protein
MGFGGQNETSKTTVIIADGHWGLESGGAILDVFTLATPPNVTFPVDAISGIGILGGNGVTAVGGPGGGEIVSGAGTGIVGIAGGVPEALPGESEPGQGQNYGVLGIGNGIAVVGQGGSTGVLGQGGTDGIGVVGQGGSTGVLGQGGTDGIGVVGKAGSGTADGVQGYGSGSNSGVAGYGDPTSNGTGVWGGGRGPDAPGVRGIGSGGDNTSPDTAVGVYGQGGSVNAYGVQGVGSGTLSGVAGFGDPHGTGPGLYGAGQGAGALGVWGIGSGGPDETAPLGGAVGVFGQAGSGNTNGMEGHASGTLAGVAGFGDLSAKGASGIGVFGQGGAPVTGSNEPGGPGMHGVGFGSAYTPLGQAVGVYGLGGAGNAPGVLGTGGSSAADGVQGLTVSGTGVRGTSNGSGFGGSFFSESGTGLVAEGNTGVPNTIGLVASGNLYAAELNGNVVVQGGNVTVSGGNVVVDGDLTVTGAKSAAVAFPDGSHRLMYCVESPESWFEDFGFAELVNGEAEVTLDPSFVAVISGDPYHVFISEYDEDHTLYATNRTRTGFRVRAKTSAAGCTFSYRVVAKRRDVTASRFAASPSASSAHLRA